MKKRKIIIGADHAGYALKEYIKTKLQDDFDVVDLGNNKFDPKDDYPDFGFMVSMEVAKTKSTGILVCGSSFGICIVANKQKGVRAVSINNIPEAIKSREHNDANIICLSGWNTKSKDVMGIVKAFLNTKLSKAPRHSRRLKKISRFENLHWK